jgi:arginine:ornithine antiporter/lysine permease
MSNNSSKKLGLMGLIAIVAGSMIGGGTFNLPQNMAIGAAAGAVMLAWVITGIGMFFLASSFRILADTRPELTGGIYTYARVGFGRFVGFEMAWGYWLSAVFGNVAFAVLVMQALGYFFPVFGDGKNWASVIGGSVLLWGMAFLVMRGVQGAAFLNVIATVAKLVPVAFIAIAVLFAFRLSEFRLDFWGAQGDLGGLMAQVKSTMLVTLWAFIGIEGAVVVSGRARKPEQVGQATLIALVMSLVVYVLLSLFPFGVMHQSEMAKLKDPSAAYLTAHIVGGWGATFVNIGVLIAILGCWLSWTILLAEVPHVAAKDGTFPRILARENRHGSPATALWVSSALMQITMFVPLFAQQAWMFLLKITGVMILPAYLASAAFLWKSAMQKNLAASVSQEPGEGRTGDPPTFSRWFMLLTGVLASTYAAWLLYAAGPRFLLLSLILFVLGIPVYWWAHREQQHRMDSGDEKGGKTK